MVKKRIQILVRLALLVAVEVILSRFLSISTPINKIGFAFVPLALAGTLYGPWAGLGVGAVADLLGATLFPSGPYFPGFTLTTALKGLVFGLCLHNSRAGNWRAITLAVCINAIVFSLGLNTLWIHMLYGSPYHILLISRIVQELVVIPVQIVVLRVVGAAKIQRALA